MRYQAMPERKKLKAKKKDSPGEDGENRRVHTNYTPQGISGRIIGYTVTATCMRLLSLLYYETSTSQHGGSTAGRPVSQVSHTEMLTSVECAWCRRGDSNPHPLIGD